MILTSLLLFLTAISHPQSNSWHGIVPLHSTRADVENILGPPTPDSKARDGAEYRTENERVIVAYSAGPCSAKNNNGWNVSRGTVIEISVYPNIKPKVVDLKLDESKYRKVRDGELSSIIYYTNEEGGISIEVNIEQGVANAFRYSDTSKDYYLRCPVPNKSSTQATGLIPRKIAEYSDISFESEKNYLDSFAEQLLNTPTSQGYIFAYAGRRACKDETLSLAKRAKKYLVNKGGIPASQLVIVDAGYKERWAIELYIVPPGTVMPPATSTVDPSSVRIVKNCNSKRH
jgi:hypothetical protein